MHLATVVAARKHYANSFDVGFDAFEFIVECRHADPGDQDSDPHTRLVMSPAIAKQLARILSRAVADYERDFGVLPSADIVSASDVSGEGEVT